MADKNDKKSANNDDKHNDRRPNIVSIPVAQLAAVMQDLGGTSDRWVFEPREKGGRTVTVKKRVTDEGAIILELQQGGS